MTGGVTGGPTGGASRGPGDRERSSPNAGLVRNQALDWAAWLTGLNRRSMTAELDAISAPTPAGRRAHEAEARAARALHALVERLRPGARGMVSAASIQAVVASVTTLRHQLASPRADDSEPTAALRLCDDAVARLAGWADAVRMSTGPTAGAEVDGRWSNRRVDTHTDPRARPAG